VLQSRVMVLHAWAPHPQRLMRADNNEARFRAGRGAHVKVKPEQFVSSEACTRAVVLQPH
jgi:hypothetical protein